MRKYVFLLPLILLAGCGLDQDENKSVENVRHRQDSALSDPYNYSPFRGQATDVSGGGITDFNSKAFKRDANSVFNP